MKKNLVWTVALLAAVSLSTACGSDDDKNDGTGGTGGVGGTGGTGGTGGSGGTGGDGGSGGIGGSGGETGICTQTSDCETGVCDIDTGMCVTCTASEGCSGDTPVCNTDVEGGVCVGCLSDSNCGDQVCDTETNTCVGCLETADCETGVCDTEINSCVTCTADEGCTDGFCKTSVAGGQCVECTADNHCEEGEACADATNTCGPRGLVEINELRAATAVTGGSFPITDVLVTYTRAKFGSDDAGFFVQAEPTGPALFVAVEGDMPVDVGDTVAFTATDARVLDDGNFAVTGFSGLSVASTGNDLSGYVQNLSDAGDVVSELDAYEHELVSLSGTLGAFAGAGNGHVQMNIATAGIPTGAMPRLRMPISLQDELDIAEGCTVTLNQGPMWRFRTTAQPSAYVAADLTVTDCPAPVIDRAHAASETEVRIIFDRRIAAASVSAADFDFTPALDVTGVSVSERTVTLTTEPQDNVVYTVSIAAGAITDIYGKGVVAGQATFNGFVPMTGGGLVINEVDYDNIGAGDNAEFVEILNTGDTAIDLTGVSLVLVNGASSQLKNYAIVDLDAAGSLDPGQYLVVANATVAVATGAKVVAWPGAENQVQNGGSTSSPEPDGIALFDRNERTIIDALSYEGELTSVTIDGTAGYNLVEGTALPVSVADSNSVDGSLNRIPNGRDTNDAAADWAFSTTLTPGAANVP